MSRRFLTISAGVIAALALVLTEAGIAATPLPAGWWHVEVNVMVNHVPHTLVYDRGRVVAATTSSLLLRERDGSRVLVAVSPSTRVMIDGAPGSFSQIQRGWQAQTLRIDGGPASQIHAHPPLVASSTTTTTR